MVVIGDIQVTNIPVHRGDVRVKSNSARLRLGFDCRLKRHFHRVKLYSDDSCCCCGNWMTPLAYAKWPRSPFPVIDEPRC
jgi:hypothetical protein